MTVVALVFLATGCAFNSAHRKTNAALRQHLVEGDGSGRGHGAEIAAARKAQLRCMGSCKRFDDASCAYVALRGAFASLGGAIGTHRLY